MENLYLKIKNKLKDFDLYIQDIETETVEFENNKLKSITRKNEKGYGLRIVKDNKIGFSSSNNFGDVDTVIENAVSLSALGEKCYFKFPDKKFETEELNIFSSKIAELKSQEMIDIGTQLLDSLISLDKTSKVSVIVEKSIIKNSLFNSNELALEEKKTRFSIIGTIFKAEENNFIEIWESETFRAGDEIEKLIKSIYQRIEFLYNNVKKIARIEPGYYPVYFTPKAFSTILNMILKSFDGTLVYKNISFFANKKNQEIFKKPVTIFDNPLKKGYPYSRNFDGEGLKPEPVYLIEKGAIKNYLLDLQSAGRLNTIPNGHSLRSYSSLPSPGYTNIQFIIGDKNIVDTKTNIIKHINKGVLIDHFLGAGQSNILAGEFSMNIDLGYLIENGEITGRIKDCMVAGNMFELLNDIEKIDDTVLYYAGIETPGVLVHSLPVR